MRTHFLKITLILVLSLLVALGIVFLAKGERSSYKYEIVDANKQHYRTLAYTKGPDGCITFQKSCGCGDNELETVILCGTYTIIENKDYEPNAQ
jgi:hypothetical protein